MAWPHCDCRDGRPQEYPVSAYGWPHCERLDGMSSQISFPHLQSIFISTPTYFLPNSSDRRPEFSARLGGGGGVVLTMSPSRTAASVVVPVSSTIVTTSSATESRAVPVVLYL